MVLSKKAKRTRLGRQEARDGLGNDVMILCTGAMGVRSIFSRNHWWCTFPQMKRGKRNPSLPGALLQAHPTFTLHFSLCCHTHRTTSEVFSVRNFCQKASFWSQYRPQRGLRLTTNTAVRDHRLLCVSAIGSREK